RKWLVVEFDITKFARDGKTPTEWKPLLEDWAKADIEPKYAQAVLIWHLAQFCMPALVVDSGGKSLHTGFPVKHAPADWLSDFIRLARTLGADKAMRTPSQLFRMPGGLRDGFMIDQPILYFNNQQAMSNE